MYGFKSQKMNVNYPHCNLKFERELGYLYVAMFVSYVFNVAQMIAAAVITYLITCNLESPWLYMGIIFPIVFILVPFNYRFSRVIIVHWLTPGLHCIPEMSRDRNIY